MPANNTDIVTLAGYNIQEIVVANTTNTVTVMRNPRVHAANHANPFFSTKYSLIIEFSRRKEDNTLSGISITVRFPDDSSASQHLRAIMPVTSTLVVLGILMVWSAFAIHKSFFILSLILGVIAFRAHLQASPFAPYRGELCIHLDAKNICGFRYLNRLTVTGMVTL